MQIARSTVATITCPDCGGVQTIPLLPPRGTAECYRCDRLLDRRVGVRLDVCFAACIGVVLLLPPAAFLPLMQSSIRNVLFEQSRLISSVPAIYSEVWFPFAFGFLFFAVLFPTVRALLLILVLASIRWHRRLPQRGRIFRGAEELRMWSMTDVVVIAGAVTYFRAGVPADVDLRIGAWCYIAVAALAFVADHTLDRRGVWNAILPDAETLEGRHFVSCGVCEMTVTTREPGHPCPRCGATLAPSIGRSLMPAAAAVTAAIPLVLPAYTYSVMVNEQIGGIWEHTVIGTIQLLADYGHPQGGAIVLVTGIVIPLASLAVLIWFLARVRDPERHGLVRRTRIYRLLHRLVRWPMVIPFIAATAAPIVDFRNIDDIFAGPGSTPFFAFIVLMMIAVRLFDPRLMWLTAGEAT